MMNTSMQTNKHQIGKTTEHRKVIWIVAALIATFIVWAKFAILDEIVRGAGKVVPTGKTQIVQNLEGGILAELNVKEGDEVAQGQIVAKLSDTKFKGSFGELEREQRFLKIKLARLSKEIEKSDSFSPSNENQKFAPNIAKSEVQLFTARLQEYNTTKLSLEDSVKLYTKELNLLSKLSKDGVVPPLDAIQAEQKTSEARKKLNSLETEYMLTRTEEYAETLAELKKLEQTLSIREDQFVRTTLKSPARAIVNKVLVSTIGGVVGPGEEILELIPLDDELLIEAKIDPKDIAFVHPNMNATIKFTAYDYTIYGSFQGTVRHISADTFEDETRRDGTPYYKVGIEINEKDLEFLGKEIAIRPGMLAEAELLSRKTFVQGFSSI